MSAWSARDGLHMRGLFFAAESKETRDALFLTFAPS
jgi:hypothetical protein